MLIINQWATNAVSYIIDDIKQSTELVNNKPTQRLYINGECFAQVDNQNIMDKINYDLHSFIDKAKRATDTFDIGAEIHMILINEDNE